LSSSQQEGIELEKNTEKIQDVNEDDDDDDNNNNNNNAVNPR
jgi:hypothetical protein